MLIITDTPFELMKYHIINTNNEDRKVKILRSSDLEEVKSALLDSVDYEDEQLVSVLYIIYYEGTKILDKDFVQDKNNKTYLIVKSLNKYNHLKDSATLFTLPLTQYQNSVSILQALLTADAWEYFWKEYCVKRFKASPHKCYNEAMRLLILFKQRGNKKLTIEDIDDIYNNVSTSSREYLNFVFSPKGKEIILTMNNSEMFLLFVRGKTHKAPVQTVIENVKPQCVYAYSIFKEAFFEARIGLREGILILDYILNKETLTTTKEILNLFNVK